MAFRTAGGLFKIKQTNKPQPLFGSWVTAGAGFAAPSDSPLVLTLGDALGAGGVNDADQIFKAGEDVWLINADGSNPETAHVMSISGNTLTLGPQNRQGMSGRNPVTERSHVAGVFGTGTFILPKQMASNFIVIYEDGSAGPWLYVGDRWNFTSTAHRIYKLAFVTTGVQPTFYSTAMSSPGNPYDMSELWTMGVAADLYGVSMNID